jgi:hypothetical protein
MIKKNNLKYFGFLIKLLILGLTFFYIYKEIFHKSELSEIKQTYQNLFKSQK